MVEIPITVFAEMYWTASDKAINQLDEIFGRMKVDQLIKIADQTQE